MLTLPSTTILKPNAKERYRLKNKDKINAQNKKRYRENPMIQSLRNARVRANKKGLPFEISTKDLKIPEYYPVLGIKLEVSDGWPKYSSPSLDRIDPSKGYIKDNVRVISSRANSLKSNMTLEECELILKDLKNVENSRTAHSLS